MPQVLVSIYFSSLGRQSFKIFSKSSPIGRDFLGSMALTGLPWRLSGKENACNAGDLGFDPWVGKTPGGGHGNPLQCSCLENPRDRGAERAADHGVVKSRT